MQELNGLPKKLKGSVLVIGFDDNGKLVNDLKNNNSINNVYTLNNNSKEKKKKNKRKKKFIGERNIDIKKLKKEFKKQSFDYIICDFDTITPFFRSFVKNSILLASEKVYLYVQGLDYEHEEIRYRYERYGSKVLKKGAHDEYLFEINVTKIKISFFKSFRYWLKDIRYDFVEFIANILIG